ncbi:HAMP domain-containing protein [Thiospirochaeta perfilievii]|uniref:histidine kinase n=1 Tax=Thiospirochaeta perfilievii TaxID=252967 RepID=A0A5C1QGK3_9SPIO|nr:cache domain-containing protein [Thiospirochaeta perfilievii]QEN05696.1 HAMP domain-containing protein [Thiospirochaeta perfilievii]
MKKLKIDIKHLLLYIPLRWLLVTPLVILFIISSISIFTLFTGASNDSTKESVSLLMNRIQYELKLELDTYLEEALHINRTNSRYLELNIVDPYIPEVREPFFSSILDIWDSPVMSFFGDPKGEFYGARRNIDGLIEVVENNQDTNGASHYFSINDSGRAEKVAAEYPGFDCRTRPWYKAALENKTAVFSPIYKHFVFNDLAITASLPMYREDGEIIGVFGVDFLLNRINTFLKENRIIDNMVIFIVENDTGHLIANSENVANFISEDNNKLRRLRPDESGHTQLKQIYLSLMSVGDNTTVRRDSNLIGHTSYKKENLKWDLYISIPEETFLSVFKRISIISIFYIILFIILTIIMALYLSKTITGPISNLSLTAEYFSNNHLDIRVPIKGNNEVTRLSISFNTMAEELQDFFENLEKKVSERTIELTDKVQIIEDKNRDLRLALEKINTLEGIIPICSYCKNIRNDEGYWKRVEEYFSDVTEAQFSHSLCPDCVKKYYPDIANKILKEEE